MQAIIGVGSASIRGSNHSESISEICGIFKPIQIVARFYAIDELGILHATFLC